MTILKSPALHLTTDLEGFNGWADEDNVFHICNKSVARRFPNIGGEQRIRISISDEHHDGWIDRQVDDDLCLGADAMLCELFDAELISHLTTEDKDGAWESGALFYYTLDVLGDDEE